MTLLLRHLRRWLFGRDALAIEQRRLTLAALRRLSQRPTTKEPISHG
jgi:hypothetical protein